jgi:hypothetical protein
MVFKLGNKSPRYTHGDSGGGRTYRSPEYQSWVAMKNRCTNPNQSKTWPQYGGRGITVCKRWFESYQAFLADMGRKPSRRHVLDRIDNDGNYESENCRWLSRTESARNKRNNRLVIVDGRRMTMTEAAGLCGIKPQTLWYRLHIGWPLERALSPRLAWEK